MTIKHGRSISRGMWSVRNNIHFESRACVNVINPSAQQQQYIKTLISNKKL